MEKYMVVGHYSSSFKNKEDEIVSYGKLFLNPVEPPEKGVLSGEYIETMSVKPALLTNVSVGDTISLIFNKYGKVQDIAVV